MVLVVPQACLSGALREASMEEWGWERRVGSGDWGCRKVGYRGPGTESKIRKAGGSARMVGTGEVRVDFLYPVKELLLFPQSLKNFKEPQSNGIRFSIQRSVFRRQGEK